MSNKRQRGSSSQSLGFDNSKFVTKDASDRYYKTLEGKTFVLERGLRPAETDGEMGIMIAERNWLDLTEQPDPAVIPVVKEFYANALNRVNHTVQVRGRVVSFDRATINAYFNIPEPEEESDYTEYDFDLDTVITRLTKPGTQWTTRQDSTEKISFPYNALSKYGKAWYNFICANLMPTRHANDVTKDRAKLLFAIVNTLDLDEKEIDVGEIIQQSILRFLDGKTSGGIPHASLVTGLCKQAGVRWEAHEPLLQPMAIIDHTSIGKIKAWPGGISHPRGEGYIMQPQEPQMQEPEPQPAQAEHGDPSVLAAVQRLQSQVDRQNRTIARQGRKIDAISGRMVAMMQFNMDFAQALSGVFARGASSSGASIPVPTYSNVPDYPSDSTDEEGNPAE